MAVLKEKEKEKEKDQDKQKAVILTKRLRPFKSN